jgi:hypothetical protein
MIGAVVRCYGLTNYLTGVLKQYNWLGKIAVLNYKFNRVEVSPDNTAEVVAKLGQSNVKLYSGDSLDQHSVLNMGVEILQDCELIFISDADEFILRADQQKLIDNMEGESVATVDIIDYVDFNRRFPIRGHKPPVLVRPDVRFHDVRCHQAGARYFKNTFMHHLGYTYNPVELDWKFKWEKEWEGNTTRDLMCQTHIDSPLPQEIKDLL